MTINQKRVHIVPEPLFKSGKAIGPLGTGTYKYFIVEPPEPLYGCSYPLLVNHQDIQSLKYEWIDCNYTAPIDIMEYQFYLFWFGKYQEAYCKSDYWSFVKQKQLEKYPNCEHCAEQATDCHHTKYNGVLTNEVLGEDLISLCRDCHTQYHKSRALSNIAEYDKLLPTGSYIARLLGRIDLDNLQYYSFEIINNKSTLNKHIRFGLNERTFVKGKWYKEEPFPMIIGNCYDIWLNAQNNKSPIISDVYQVKDDVDTSMCPPMDRQPWDDHITDLSSEARFSLQKMCAHLSDRYNSNKK